MSELHRVLVVELVLPVYPVHHLKRPRNTRVSVRACTQRQLVLQLPINRAERLAKGFGTYTPFSTWGVTVYGRPTWSMLRQLEMGKWLEAVAKPIAFVGHVTPRSFV